MCGIAGLVSKVPLSQDEREQVACMNRALTHRGPDGGGELQDANVALAVRRLSIIDLAGGWQPLYNEDRSLALIANGEIYNYIELRSQLQTRGHRFATGSDCETILHLYEDHGTDCLKYLRGMFAFALWDRRRKRIMLARDRMGEKPLYLYQQAHGLLFASELKALLSSNQVPFELDPIAVDQYFHFHYVPEPKTPIKGVRKLSAGHYLTIDVEPWIVTERRYWNMEDAPELTGDPVELIRAELETISEIVVRSDVPVGVALSGGLDSSAITALAARKYPSKMHAFSIGYPNRPPTDERAEAKRLADYLELPFHDVEINPTDMVDFFPELVYWRDDPIADISGYGYYMVMRAAREQGVPVMLQGQGGDELFWGYPWVRQAARESRAKQAGRTSLLDSIEITGPSKWSPGGIKMWLDSVAGLRPSWARYQRFRTSPSNQMVFFDLRPDFQMARAQMHNLYNSTFAEQLNGADPSLLFSFTRPWRSVDVRIVRLIYETYLLGNGIAQGDRLSMASSVELRLPLVDYRLVEVVTGLRKTQSDSRLSSKTWFKSALRGVLPNWVLNRPKRGFAPPVREWHRTLFAKFGSHILDGYLVQERVLRPEVAEKFATGPFPAGSIVPLSFKALVLEEWSRRMSVMARGKGIP